MENSSGLYSWLGKHTNSKYGIYILILLLLTEGFFIMPSVTIFTLYCLHNRKKSFFYALIATLASIGGALIGYYIGFLLWQHGGEAIIHKFISPDKFLYVKDLYMKYEALAIFFISFSPIPFKVITISSGFFKLSLLPFLFYTVIARGLRFFIIATGVYIWGEKVHYYLNKYFYYVLAFFIIFFISLLVFVH